MARFAGIVVAHRAGNPGRRSIRRCRKAYPVALPDPQTAATPDRRRPSRRQNELDARSMSAGARKSFVAGEQRRVQAFGEGDVNCVIG